MKKRNDNFVIISFALVLVLVFIALINIVFLEQRIDVLEDEIRGLQKQAQYFESELQWYDKHWIELVNE